MDSQTRAALWQAGWVAGSIILAAAGVGIMAVISDSDLVNRFIAGEALGSLWRPALLIFLPAAIMAAKKYWKWEVPAPARLSKPPAPRKAKKPKRSDEPA